MSTTTEKKLVDKESLRQVLIEVGNNFTEAARVFKAAGYSDCITPECVSRHVKKDPILAAMFSAGAPTEESTIVRVEPAGEKRDPTPEMLQRQSDYMTLTHLQNAGYTDKKIQNFMCLSDFVMFGFKRAVDYSYGTQMQCLDRLIDRALDLERKMEDESMVERGYFDKEGVRHTFTGKRFDDAEKQEVLDRWIAIMALVNSYTQATNQAALIRVKALMLDKGKFDGHEPGKQGKTLKPRDKEDATNV